MNSICVDSLKDEIIGWVEQDSLRDGIRMSRICVDSLRDGIIGWVEYV